MTIITNETHAHVVKLTQGATNEAKAILYHAYKNEPTFKYLFDYSSPGYDQRVRATIRELINLHFSTGQDVIGLTLDNHLIAVALLGSPAVRLNLTREFSWRAKMMLTAGMDCTWRYINYHNQIHTIMPSESHHELPLMGVDTRYRNSGYGRQLLQVIESICRENKKSKGIGLDTGNGLYLDFYKSMGFEEIGEIQIGNVQEHVLYKHL